MEGYGLQEVTQRVKKIFKLYLQIEAAGAPQDNLEHYEDEK